jgi:hypothetical protein
VIWQVCGVGRDREEFAKLPLPRRYNCIALIALVLKQPRYVGMPDLSHGIGGRVIRLGSK